MTDLVLWAVNECLLCRCFQNVAHAHMLKAKDTTPHLHVHAHASGHTLFSTWLSLPPPIHAHCSSFASTSGWAHQALLLTQAPVPAAHPAPPSTLAAWCSHSPSFPLAHGHPHPPRPCLSNTVLRHVPLQACGHAPLQTRDLWPWRPRSAQPNMQGVRLAQIKCVTTWPCRCVTWP